MCQAGLAVLHLALSEQCSAIQALVAFSTCTEMFSPSISETRILVWDIFLVQNILDDDCRIEGGLKVVSRRPESLLEDKPQRGSGTRKIAVAVLGQTRVHRAQFSDSRHPGKMVRTS